MRVVHFVLASLALMAALVAAPARAETYHACHTFITSLPTVISTQGVYCLNKDLTTAITSGNALYIQTNNVTIDCNNFKIGGLAGGSSSTAAGIVAGAGLLNITVRNCGVRGYYEGIFLQGGAGHLVEDNRLDNNLYVGIDVSGEHNTIRRNRIYDTGGYPSSFAIGILAEADVIDNNVSGVFAVNSSPILYGINIHGVGNIVRGNEVSGLTVGAGGSGYGIIGNTNAVGSVISGNFITGYPLTSGTGIQGRGAVESVCRDNSVLYYTLAMDTCANGGGNVTN
jgi:parallel beta-helix repeat protein